MNTYNVNEMIGKAVVFKNKNFVIEDYMISKGQYDIDTLYFKLKLAKGKSDTTSYIPTMYFINKLATTEDESLNAFVAKCNADYSVAYEQAVNLDKLKTEEANKRREEQRILELERERFYAEQQTKLGTEKGSEDARENFSKLYKMFTSLNSKDILKSESYSREFQKAYITTYEHEKDLIKKERLLSNRSGNDVLKTYPGDVDRLVTWIREHVSRIDVFASPDKIENEQKVVDALNKRDNTNYQVKLRQGQFVAYEATMRDLDNVPTELLSWKVDKHDYTTADLKSRVLALALNTKTKKITCNALIKELLYNDEHNFHVGSYKKSLQ